MLVCGVCCVVYGECDGGDLGVIVVGCVVCVGGYVSGVGEWMVWCGCDCVGCCGIVCGCCVVGCVCVCCIVCVVVLVVVDDG